MSDWTEFGVREGMSISARSPVRKIPEVAAFFEVFLAENDALLAEPFRGITTEGVIAARNRTSNRDRHRSDQGGGRGISGFAGCTDALALELSVRVRTNGGPGSTHTSTCIDTGSCSRSCQPFNGMHSSICSASRCQVVAMRRRATSCDSTNLLAEVTGRADDYGEWPYFVSFFGLPSEDVPWGFQFDGHHLAINCAVVGNELATDADVHGFRAVRQFEPVASPEYECSMSRSVPAST